MKRVLILQRPGTPRSHFENSCSIFRFLVNINILPFFVFSRQLLQSKPHHSSEHIKLAHVQQSPKLTSVLSALRKGTVGLSSRNPAEPLWVVPLTIVVVQFYVKEEGRLALASWPPVVLYYLRTPSPPGPLGLVLSFPASILFFITAIMSFTPDSPYLIFSGLKDSIICLTH